MHVHKDSVMNVKTVYTYYSYSYLVSEIKGRTDHLCKPLRLFFASVLLFVVFYSMLFL